MDEAVLDTLACCDDAGVDRAVWGRTSLMRPSTVGVGILEWHPSQWNLRQSVSQRETVSISAGVVGASTTNARSLSPWARILAAVETGAIPRQVDRRFAGNPSNVDRWGNAITCKETKPAAGWDRPCFMKRREDLAFSVLSTWIDIEARCARRTLMENSVICRDILSNKRASSYTIFGQQDTPTDRC